MEDQMSETSVTITENAAKRIADILSSEAGKEALRISVEGGGCSGFSYKFDLTEGGLEDDIVVERGNARVLIDKLSLIYMAGAEIDFVDNLLGQSFQINNPNAVASCGCGTSFAI
jgi:iron-sulfur cluster assembly accessory protein